ncbi:helix-turn-helix domain-containing protein [Xanthomonas sp. NCPPB 2632]|uniref:helix-turn-helix domain-containing protein n=1 Tax=Xanthomonas sp. NCPPB 2632 TaxID=3240912 RepID=UPI00351505B3
MNSTIILLDRYREICSLPSDNQVAIKLGVTRGAISNWRQGRSHAEPESVQAMAKACGLDQEEWVLRVQADREIIAARKQVWLRAAQRLAATAALVTLTFGLDVQTAKANFHGEYTQFREIPATCILCQIGNVAFAGP